VLAGQGAQANDVLFEDRVALGSELVEGNVHIPSREQGYGVQDEAEGADLVFLAFSVALAQLASLAVEDAPGKGVAGLLDAELVADLAPARRRPPCSARRLLSPPDALTGGCRRGR